MSKKTVWEQLNELPRDERKERESWRKIESKLKRPKIYPFVLTSIVTIGMVFFIFSVLSNEPANEHLQQTTQVPTIQSLYFIEDTEFDEFKVKPSRWYTFINERTDKEQLKELQRYLDNSVSTEKPSPSITFTHGLYTDILLEYSNGTLKGYKILITGMGYYFYSVDTKEWFYSEDYQIGILFRDLFKIENTNWLPIFIFLSIIFTNIAEKLLKKRYKLKKIIFGGEHSYMKYLIYMNKILFFLVVISTVYSQWILHVTWILALFILLNAISLIIELKYGENRAAMYLLISSSIGDLLFVLVFIFSIL